MKTRMALAAFTLSITLTAGCSMTHGSPKNPAKNPHPVKRYEVIATSQAPGPWDSIEGYIGYDVVNKKCLPMDSFLGEQDVPNIGVDIEMTRMDEHTWKGYFYRDALQDEDYYKLGVCHWDVTSVAITAVAKGVRFNWSHTLNTLLRDGLQTSYFKKSVYGDPAAARHGAQTLTAEDPDVVQHPDAYFPVTVVVKDVIP
ncbi:hypothetical protein [Xanthomonas sp. 3498]|uniref:hypothetical protein n=1 Tax=Xanthomonas sp. 3498 TaxID=2663863 RepID=UPI0017965B33|nr:hypothetical protein [Xanthomonas sp. 3498]MBB5876932.1 hypothetical protein [Xanthomonas sp. 3498]